MLTADKNFHKQNRLRALLHQPGIVPNIHHTGHAESRESTESEQAEAAGLQFDLA